MAFAYAFEKLDGNAAGKESSKVSSTPSATLDHPNTANPVNNQAYPTYPTYPTSTNPTYSPSNYPTYSTSTNPTYSPPTNPAQTQNGYQQRAVDRELPADIFGEPHFESCFIDSIADGIIIISGSSEARSTSDNNNQNRRGAN